MTELTDDQVKALLAHYDLPTDCDCDGDDCVKCSHYPTFQERASKQLKDAAPDIARALLSTRAELARVRADAQAAVARAYEAAAERLDLAEHDAEERDWRSGANAFAALAKGLRALAPADGLAAVDALRAEIADLKMNMDADLRTMVREGQQLRTLAAELAAAQQREAELLAALEDPLVVHLNMVAGKIAKPLPSQLAHIYGEDVIRAALAPTPPADTWHERRTMLPDGDARKGEG